MHQDHGPDQCWPLVWAVVACGGLWCVLYNRLRPPSWSAALWWCNMVVITSTITGRIDSSSSRDHATYMWECFGPALPSIWTYNTDNSDGRRKMFFRQNNSPELSTKRYLLQPAHSGAGSGRQRWSVIDALGLVHERNYGITHIVLWRQLTSALIFAEWIGLLVVSYVILTVFNTSTVKKSYMKMRGGGGWSFPPWSLITVFGE